MSAEAVLLQALSGPRQRANAGRGPDPQPWLKRHWAMNTLTSNFRPTEEILSSSPADLVRAAAASAAIALRCAASVVVERAGAKRLDDVPALNAR